MNIITDLFFIVLGIYLVLSGANRLTDGAVVLAQKMKIPQMVIGLTIVAIGTSLPELCVSLASAFQGTTDMAVGNVVGSNIFNSLLIVGCASAVTPITIAHSTVRRDMPWAVFASVLLLLFCMDGNFSRVESVILLVLLVVFMWFTLHHSDSAGSDTESAHASVTVGKALFWLLLGVFFLPAGSYVFVNHASHLASVFGISDAVIGLTIVAGGTSLPELATSIVAAKKGQSAIAIGNVLGSNVFNILLILGLTGAITPFNISGITVVDYSMLVGSIFLLWLFCRSKYRVERWEGYVLILLFIGYISYLIATA